MGFASLGEGVAYPERQPMHHILEKLAESVERDGASESSHKFGEFMGVLSLVALRMAQHETNDGHSPYDGYDV